MQVWPWEVASDGVEMRNFTPHGTQVFLMRSVAVDTDLLGKGKNVKVVLIIPGPTVPKSYAPYWSLVLKLFAETSFLGGTLASLRSL